MLCNTRRHNAQLLRPRRYPRRWLDYAGSSAVHFPGFHDRGKLVSYREPGAGDRVVAPRTWLLKRGWLLVGKVATDHVPGPRAG